jgi:DNA-directed RNA polymerase subunit F
MINEKQPLTMQEANKILNSVEENDKIKDAKAFIKKFSKSKEDKAAALQKELQDLNLMKLKEKDIIKIVDFLPEEAQELNKILTEVTLDADETNKILESVKKHK